MDMEEIWKEVTWIENLRGTYEVSNLGRVRRTSLLWHDHKNGEYKVLDNIRELKQHDNGHGYLQVTFCVDSQSGRKLKCFYVHRLVATAFIENPQNLPEVNHKNFIRTNNQVTNLEWCSSLDNMKHSSSMDRRLKPKYPQPISSYKKKK